MDTSTFNEIFAKNLRNRLIMANKTQAALAKYVGVSTATVCEWTKGRKVPRMSRVDKICECLSCKRSDLLESVEMQKYETYVSIPVFSSVSAGTGAFADGNIEGYTEIPLKMARNGEYFGLRVDGDSMEPEIMHHDIIIVHKGMVPRDGQIVAAIVNGNEGFCKRFIRHENGIGLMSNNSAYKPIIFTFEEVENIPVTILGTVDRVIREYN